MASKIGGGGVSNKRPGSRSGGDGDVKGGVEGGGDGTSKRVRKGESADGVDGDDVEEGAISASEDIDKNKPTTTTTTTTTTPPPPKKNAFTELLSKKPAPAPSQPASTTTTSRPHNWHSALQSYLHLPPTSPQILHTLPFYILIPDAYPKSTLHLLLILRTHPENLTPPLTLFSPPTPSHTTHLQHALEAASFARTLVAKELKRRFNGPTGNASVARWEREVRVGIHSVPSMDTLHIHVMSPDMVSERIKGRKHYNAFNTGFFVGLEEFPILEEDERRRRRKGVGGPGGLLGRSRKLGSEREQEEEVREGWTSRELRCWRCGRGFGNKWVKLKEHLVEEKKLWIEHVLEEGKDDKEAEDGDEEEGEKESEEGGEGKAGTGKGKEK
ncbi:HIT-like domain-containing protein [Peziza echinospora]|nr:HIT-like domain-containing protein [Peziza echinospora]